MLRPTPGRLMYLLIGLIIGIVALTGYIVVAGIPTFLPSTRTNVAATGRPANEFTGTKLMRVQPVNLEASKGGVTVRINALEEYSDGFSLTYGLLSGQPGEPAPVLQPERFTLTDDRGTTYRLSPRGSSFVVGPGLSTGYLSFSPALSSDARTLTVTVPHALAVTDVSESGTPRVITGPWEIKVTLR